MTDQQTEGKTDEKKPSLLMRFWKGWVKPLVIIIFVVSTFRSAVADWNDVPTQSMEPNILVGDRILVNKLAYDLKIPFTKQRIARWSSPQRGAIIVFFHPDNGERMVKRVIGTPGDSIELRNNKLYINGSVASYQPTNLPNDEIVDLSDPPPHNFLIETFDDESHPLMLQPKRRSRRSYSTQGKIPDNMYFVMGDNRDNSGDSRFWGFVDRDLIMGEVIGLAFSLDYNNYYLPRWERFFRALP